MLQYTITAINCDTIEAQAVYVSRSDGKAIRHLVKDSAATFTYLSGIKPGYNYSIRVVIINNEWYESEKSDSLSCTVGEPELPTATTPAATPHKAKYTTSKV